MAVMRKLSLSLLLIGAVTAVSSAEVRLPKIISDNMVLQRDMAAPVWGWAEPGEEVAVTLNEKSAAAKAGADGRWMVKIGPFAAGGPYEMKVSGKNTLAVKNVLIGEVWLCNGQSNLIFRVGENTNAKEVAAAAEYPQIRLMALARDVATQPLDDVPAARWSVCSPKTVGGFSAVGYFFGRDLFKALNVPIGLIQSGVTDTGVEFYMSRQALEADPEFAFVFQRWEAYKKAEKVNENFPDIERNLHELYQHEEQTRPAYYRAKAAAEKAGTPPPPAPKWLPTRIFKNTPSGQYNAMVRPLMPMAIRGVVWYQGEWNGEQGFMYRKLFPALIKSWRAEWGEGDFPFLFVQLPRIRPDVDVDWAEMRESYLATLRAAPNTGMAVTCDLTVAPGGDWIHPPQKEPFARRLALWALATVYKQDVEYSGPLFKGAVREGAAMRVKFDYTRGGLVAKGGDLKGFVIAGEDGQFYPAKAVIDGATVLVSSPKAPRPVAVRYAWASNPDGNLCNAADLPASPFRSDNQPAITSRDLRDWPAKPDVLEWIIRRNLATCMLDDAAVHIGMWKGDPVLKAKWQARLAGLYRDAGQSAEADRIIKDALAAAEKIQEEKEKAQVIAALTGESL